MKNVLNRATVSYIEFISTNLKGDKQYLCIFSFQEYYATFLEIGTLHSVPTAAILTVDIGDPWATPL